MIWVLAILIALIGVILSGVFSGSETGFYCVSRARLHLGAQQCDASAVRLVRVLENDSSALSFALLGTNVGHYIITTAVSFVFADIMGLRDEAAELYTVALVTPIVFVFCEMVPKTLFQRHPYLWLVRVSRVLAWSFQIMRAVGALRVVTGLAEWTARFVGGVEAAQRPFEPKQRMAALLQEALADHHAADDQSHLVGRVVQLSERRVRSLMVPRNQVVSLPATAGRRDVMAVARRTSQTRIPVRDSDPRRIIGIVDIDRLLAKETLESVGKEAHPAVTISPHETIANAIARMEQSRTSMLVVTNTVGRMVGVVTLRGLIEELLGEWAVDVETGLL